VSKIEYSVFENVYFLGDGGIEQQDLAINMNAALCFGSVFKLVSGRLNGGRRYTKVSEDYPYNLSILSILQYKIRLRTKVITEIPCENLGQVSVVDWQE